MSFASTDPALTKLRDQLVAAATTAGLAVGTGNVHYPVFDGGARGAGDSLPAIEITSFRRRYVPYASGAAALPQWDADAVLYLPRTTSADEAERLADNTLAALSAQETGHVWRDLSRGDATFPTAAAEAAAAGGASTANARAVPLTLLMGLEP